MKIMCSDCGTTTEVSSSIPLGLPESLWSLVTDGICDACWFAKYL